MPTRIESVLDSSAEPAVHGFLHHPETSTGDGLVLTHGAGSDCNAPLVVALAEVFADNGFTVLRCDLPFRQQRPSGPPRGNAAIDREGLKRAVEVLRQSTPGRIFLGGQSYGGRQATMLAAEDAGLVSGLLVLSYPLHPPGKPDQLRTSHLPKIKAPSLFVSGVKDPFGSPAELESAMRLLTAPHSLLLIESAGHDLGYGRRISRTSQDLPSRTLQAFLKAF